MNMIRIPLFLLIVSTCANSSELPKSIRLATTDWCPYTCEDSTTHPGIIHDYITQLLNDLGVQVSIEFFPWSRSVLLAQNGEVDGLLTAVKSEAPALSFTSVPTDHYQMCFFSNKHNKWHYKNASNLNEIRIGVIQNYGYGEPVDTYISGADKSALYSIKSGGIPRLFQMLEASRFDAFIEDPKVVRWELKKSFEHLRSAGCLNKNPFYLAVHPNRAWAKELLNKLNEKLFLTRDRLKGIQEAYY